MNERAGASTYVLGHADTEIQRLLLQGRLYNDLTGHALRLAGLRLGMRVLDVGCGLGDVSFVAARLVGPTGTVLGVDASRDVVEFARARAAERGLSTVIFEQTTIADIAVDDADAVIGRLILMHLPDPISTLRQLAGFVRPGGLIAFCEFDIGAVRSVRTHRCRGRWRTPSCTPSKVRASIQRSERHCIRCSEKPGYACHC